MTAEIRVLTLWQPWATLWANPTLPKTIESRGGAWPSTIPLPAWIEDPEDPTDDRFGPQAAATIAGTTQVVGRCVNSPDRDPRRRCFMDDVDDTRVQRIVEFPAYEVDSNGRVWSLQGRLGARYELSTRLDKDGYRMVTLSRQGREHTRKVHTLVLTAFVGPRPPDMQARHLDGDKANNSLANLKWGTSKENADDRRRHGTLAQGASHYNTQKTECPHGHPYTPENTFTSKDGRRYCRTCQRAERQRLNAKRREYPGGQGFRRATPELAAQVAPYLDEVPQ